MFGFNSKKIRAGREDHGTVVVRGRIDGSILHAQRIVIADSGSFRGTIVTRSIEVHGVIDGNLESKSIEVFPSGKVHCENIKYDEITVHDGGFVNGYDGQKNYSTGISFTGIKPEKKKPFTVKKEPKETSSVGSSENNKDNVSGAKNEGPTFYSSY
jgi:cytoskeletal protein CcmA (bactofilin family)